MSHVATIAIEVRDLDALDKAASELGGRLLRGQTQYQQYYGRNKCDHALAFEDASYEMGVVARPDGSFTLEADFWYSGGLREKVGQNASRLRQEYAVQVAMKAAKKQGYSVRRKAMTDGSVQLVATGGK